MGETGDLAVFWIVVAARLGIPLLVFRYPLPSILGSLVVDAADQTIFQQFTSLDLTGYQGYDKALDIYYLSLAYLSTMRNWDSTPAFRVARFLFYYRLVGVAVFELTGGEHRGLLLLFPNTFEYFFIFYCLVATRWRTDVRSMRFWVAAAAFIWVFIKLPQEYWIHVAQLDFTDTVRAHPWFGVAVVVGVVALVAGYWFLVRPRLDPADHATTLQAERLPGGLERDEVRRRYRLARGGVLDRALAEKVVLVSLVVVIFAQILPGVRASALQLTVGVVVLVVVNSAVGLAAARAGRGLDSAVLTFVALAVINVVLVVVVRLLRPGSTSLDAPATLFFVLLITLIVSLYERYAPVRVVRREMASPRPAGRLAR